MRDRDHVIGAEYEATLRGEVEPAMLQKRLFNHLIKGCPTCGQHWERFCATFDPHQPAMEEEGSLLESLLRTSAERAQQNARQRQQEREQVAAWWEEFQSLDREERIVRVRRSVRVQTCTFARHVLCEAQACSRLAPAQCVEQAELALEVAWAADRAGEKGTNELMALAWALAGEGYRRLGDLRSAEQRMRMAEFHLTLRRANPSLRARVAELISFSRFDQGRFEEAEQFLRWSARTYRMAEDEESESCAQANLAVVLGEAGQAEEGLRTAERAVEGLQASPRHLERRSSRVEQGTHRGSNPVRGIGEGGGGIQEVDDPGDEHGVGHPFGYRWRAYRSGV